MIVSEYISLYGIGLLEQYPTTWSLKDKIITVAEFMQANPKFELEEFHLSALIYGNERFALNSYLDKIEDERYLTIVLRELFDEYRTSGGDALFWLHFTFDHISLNPQCFKAEHRGIIEKNLIQWIGNYKNQPYDLLSQNVKYLNSEYPEKLKIATPVISLFCSIVNELGIIEKLSLSNEAFCMKVCTFFDLPYKDRVRQNFSSRHTNRSSCRLPLF